MAKSAPNRLGVEARARRTHIPIRLRIDLDTPAPCLNIIGHERRLGAAGSQGRSRFGVGWEKLEKGGANADAAMLTLPMGLTSGMAKFQNRSRANFSLIRFRTANDSLEPPSGAQNSNRA